MRPLILVPIALLTLALAACGPAATPTAFPTSTPRPAATATPASQSAGTVAPEPTQGGSGTAPAVRIIEYQGKSIKQWSDPPPMTLSPDAKYQAVIRTSKGDMIFDLLAKEAPLTVNNFVFLARDGFYDGVIFHRIMSGFMIQSGDPTGTGGGGPGYRFPDEPVTRPYVRGTLAMANSGSNTNGSQFFVVHGAQANLDPNYNIFGVLVSGEEVLDALANVPVQLNSSGREVSSPIDPPVIHTIEIIETVAEPEY